MKNLICRDKNEKKNTKLQEQKIYLNKKWNKIKSLIFRQSLLLVFYIKY